MLIDFVPIKMNHESTCRDWKGIERERDQLRHELSNQIARYEDRLTELHSVIAELRRRLENAGTSVIPEVDEFEEVDDNDNGDDDDGQLGLSDPTRTGDGTSHVTRAHESTSHADACSNRSSEGDTSVDAIDGDLVDTRAFRIRTSRFVNPLDFSSSSGDLTRLSADMIICEKYDSLRLTSRNASVKPFATEKISSNVVDIVRRSAESQPDPSKASDTPSITTTTTAGTVMVTTNVTATTRSEMGNKSTCMTFPNGMQMVHASPDMPLSAEQTVSCSLQMPFFIVSSIGVICFPSIFSWVLNLTIK